MKRLSEFELISRLLKPLAASHAALGLGDDAALIDGPDGDDWAIAKDAIVENVHFRTDDPAETVAIKLLGTNLSDLAAMGAEPVYYLSVIARPPSLTDDWLEAFVQGLGRAQDQFGLKLIGGDTVSTDGPIVLSCTILGRVPKGQALQRSGAQTGDLICVSGTIGDAALGLRVLNGLAATDDARIYLTKRYQQPNPRVGLGIALRGLATSCIDISDGLAADVGHLLERSNVGGTISLHTLPLSDVGRHLPNAHNAALSGGDDYELAFTIPPNTKPQLAAIAAEHNVALSVIGEITTGSGLLILDEHGQAVPLTRSGWQHI